MTVRLEINVSRLPTVTFGSRDMMWWGTAGFIALEGSTLFACAVSYCYLRLNGGTWPPEHTPRPSLLWPTVQVGIMALSNLLMWRLQRFARKTDLAGVRGSMVAASMLTVVFVFLRWQDFLALNTRWDTNAYASIAWLTVGFHGSLVLLQALETIVFTCILFTGRIEEKHFSDAYDVAFYWYFLTSSWFILYALVYLSPRFL